LEDVCKVSDRFIVNLRVGIQEQEDVSSGSAGSEIARRTESAVLGKNKDRYSREVEMGRCLTSKSGVTRCDIYYDRFEDSLRLEGKTTQTRS